MTYFDALLHTDLTDERTVHTDHNHMAIRCAEQYLLVVRCPRATSYVAIVQVQHGRPVPLSSDTAHQNEAVHITNQGHLPVVAPSKVGDTSVAIIDQLNRPSALVLDPHKDDTISITSGQLLVWFIPADKDNLGPVATKVVVGA